MSKFLYINGEGDFSAIDIEESGELERIKKTMLEKGLTEMQAEDGSTCRMYEFGEVDEKFFNFVINTLCDYDLLKQSNLYMIEEEDNVDKM